MKKGGERERESRREGERNVGARLNEKIVGTVSRSNIRFLRTLVKRERDTRHFLFIGRVLRSKLAFKGSSEKLCVNDKLDKSFR